MSKQKRAADFEKIINDGRERKRNEELAARIFTRDNQGRASAPLKPAGAGGSLASRVGVKKRVSTGAARVPAGNINGDWTHDLHNTTTTIPDRPRAQQQQPAPNSLAARVHAPGTTLPKPRPGTQHARSNRTNKLANAFTRTAASSNNGQQMNVVDSNPGRGITIKGLAGPFAVLAQNFAPGTTAADIESALTPVGGIISSCRVVKTFPIVIAEIVFESKEGADRVIERFDKQTADGRTLSVYMKPGGYTAPPPTAPRAQRTNETRLAGNSVLVDGSMGFSDPMDAEDGDRGLYSDNMVPRNQTKGNSHTGGYRRDRGYRQGR